MKVSARILPLAILLIVNPIHGSALAPWVGPNIPLGQDPSVLPSGKRKNQAEPHAVRAVNDPDLVLATFQEGRFSDGGARGNGYAVSEDGGFSWRRGINPRLTLLDGGAYLRATDPVGGISYNGILYLNSLVSLDQNFDLGRLVVQRSTDRGISWTDPVTVYSGYHVNENNQVFPDKNWMVVNDYPDSLSAGRIVVTWTNFRTILNETIEIQDFLIMAAVSDDQGQSWSPPVFVTPPSGPNRSVRQYQGSQSVFLPGGSLAVVYHNFLAERLEVRYSADGGGSFPFGSTALHNRYLLYDAPNFRDGSFLPSVGVARESGDLFITYTSRESKTGIRGHVYFVRSRWRDPGTSPAFPPDWNFSTPMQVSGSLPVRVVANPTISVSPDGRRVTIYFFDNRNDPGMNNFGDFHAVQSVDGGSTWTAPFRLTEQTFDLRKSTNTDRGYMIGDYFGFAAPQGPGQAGVAVWVDTSGASADPVSARIGGLEGTVFNSWLQANLPYAARDRGETALREADSDGDDTSDFLEYILGLSPRLPEPVLSLEDGLTHLLLSPSSDPLTQVAVRGGTGRWPYFQAVSDQSPEEVPFGEGYWIQTHWPNAGNLDHLEVTVNGSERWFLLDNTAPVRWVRALDGGWVRSPWFGYLYTPSAPWLYHLSLGWLYDRDGALYSPQFSSYLFTSSRIYPWVARQDGSFLFVLEGTPWVYDASMELWTRTD